MATWAEVDEWAKRESELGWERLSANHWRSARTTLAKWGSDLRVRAGPDASVLWVQRRGYSPRWPVKGTSVAIASWVRWCELAGLSGGAGVLVERDRWLDAGAPLRWPTLRFAQPRVSPVRPHLPPLRPTAGGR